MMFMSVFQAASVLNLGGSIGVGASYVLLLAFLVKPFIFRKRRSLPHGQGRKAAAILIIAFTAYAFVSAFAFPLLFRGALYSNPKMGSHVPLQWETIHLNQLFYLILCVALFFAVSNRTSIGEVKQSLDWYIAGNCLASVIGLFQLFCLKTGLPYPSQFLDTNPAYGIFKAYEISGFARINSTFTEASAAAGSLTPALALLLWRLLDKPNKKDATAAALVFTGLFLSISTTGYLCFGFLALVCTLIYLFKWSNNARTRALKLTSGGILAVLAIALMAVPPIREDIFKLLDVVIFTKTGTVSYEERTQWNFDALQTAADTHWLGAGWGICRASSVVPTLLGNVGIPGLSLFAAFALQMFLPAWRIKRKLLPIQGQVMLATSIIFVGLIVAGPEVTSPQMWVFFAAATATFPMVALREGYPLAPVWRYSRFSAVPSSTTPLES